MNFSRLFGRAAFVLFASILVASCAAVAQTPAPADTAALLDRILAVLPTVLGILTTAVTVASLVVAGTNTPDPATPLGKLYKVLELLALVVGKAKQTGVKSILALLLVPTLLLAGCTATGKFIAPVSLKQDYAVASASFATVVAGATSAAASGVLSGESRSNASKAIHVADAALTGSRALIEHGDATGAIMALAKVQTAIASVRTSVPGASPDATQIALAATGAALAAVQNAQQVGQLLDAAQTEKRDLTGGELDVIDAARAGAVAAWDAAAVPSP